jgi:hypothetical protein
MFIFIHFFSLKIRRKGTIFLLSRQSLFAGNFKSRINSFFPACCLAFAATDTFQMIGCFVRLNIHFEDAVTFFTLSAFCRVNPVFVGGNEVEQRKQCAPWTQIFAEWTVNND